MLFSLQAIALVAVISFPIINAVEPQYKLTYFDTRMRGEFVRLVLAAAGQKFEDVRLSTAEWTTLKPTMPWGQIPVLEVDGQQLGQTSAILRYLGQKYGLLPTGANPLFTLPDCIAKSNTVEFEQALTDSIVDETLDIFDALEAIIFRTADAQKPNATKTFLETTFPDLLHKIERFIDLHGSNGHVVGPKLTTGDISVFCVADLIMDNLIKSNSSYYNDYPKVKAVMDTVKSNENIAAYLKTRK